jgi:predicted nucleic acid-binding protein
VIYWDTSCVVKLYAAEPDSERLLALAVETDGSACCSAVLTAELFYALSQKELRQEIKPAAAGVLFSAYERDVESGRFVLLPVGQDVLADAIEVAKACSKLTPPIPVRTLDGIHLATARLLRVSRMVTTAARMRAAARQLGIPTSP